MNITPFTYQGIALQESCWIDGTPFFTRRSIGEFLEAKFPYVYVSKIVNRNPHIKIFSTRVNLVLVEGGKTVAREVEVYNPIGLQIIMMKSNLPKAILYQIAVAQLVWALMNGEIKPSKWSQKNDLVSAARQILSLPMGRKRGALVRDLAERDGVSLQTAYRRVNKSTGKRLKTTKGRAIYRKDKGSTRYPEEKERVLTYIKEHPGAGGKRIKEILVLSASSSRVNAWIRENRNINLLQVN